MTEPTQDQIKNCKVSGWHYDGDGLFTRGDDIGWFEGRQFKRA